MVFKITNANLACRRFSGDLILCLPLVINEMLVNALKNKKLFKCRFSLLLDYITIRFLDFTPFLVR